jgi:DNA-directed RNA polymerase specialized sigma24 family protein
MEVTLDNQRSRPAELTGAAFAKLLECLDADRERAGEKYEDLRRTLLRFFEWRGAPFPEEHTDETLDRVARKLDAGVEVQNLGGYCYEVARLVFLETLKGRDSKRAPLDEAEFTVSAPNVAAELDEAEEHGRRLECLENCLRRLPVESRELITEYYRDDRRDRIDRRTTLAARLGIRRGALANRAQRVRDKLERCVTVCLKKKRAR